MSYARMGAALAEAEAERPYSDRDFMWTEERLFQAMEKSRLQEAQAAHSRSQVVPEYEAEAEASPPPPPPGDSGPSGGGPSKSPGCLVL